MSMKRTALLIAALAAAPAYPINKCLVEGRVTFQDAPCDEARETVAEGLARRRSAEKYHQRLDELAAQGQGLVQRAPAASPAPAAASPPVIRIEEPWQPRPRSVTRAWEEQRRRAREQSELSQRRNAENAAILTQTLDAENRACHGGLVRYPTIGMSDANFRNCTIHARHGGVTQIVATEEDGIQLRLYVFPGNKASRVYSVDGVVTLIRP